jgi:hypothetical protein
MKKIVIASLLLIFTLPLIVSAQDIIYKKNNDSIVCIIREVGTEAIKYNLLDYSQMVLFAIDKNKVSKIVFSDGQGMEFQNEMKNEENYLDDRRRAIKIDFISPLTGNTTFSYEQSLKPGRSLEGSVGLIGLGLDPGGNNPRGLFVGFGLKLIKSPDFYFSRMRYAHLLKGGYIKPEVSLALYAVDRDNYYYGHSRETIFSGAIMVNFGKQWIFDNVMLFDMYVGVGYGFSTSSYNNGMVYNFGYATGPPQFPIALTAGINIGYLLK